MYGRGLISFFSFFSKSVFSFLPIKGWEGTIVLHWLDKIDDLMQHMDVFSSTHDLLLLPYGRDTLCHSTGNVPVYIDKKRHQWCNGEMRCDGRMNRGR